MNNKLYAKRIPQKKTHETMNKQPLRLNYKNSNLSHH